MSQAASPGPQHSVAARFDKLVLLRLVQVCEEISSDAPDLAERTGFTEMWALGRALSPEGLIRASRQPLAVRWVSTAEALVRNGIHKRYPDAHPSRHLKDFGRLLISWAPHLPSGRTMQIGMAGCAALQLFHGSRILAHDAGPTHSSLQWTVANGLLHVTSQQGDVLVAAAEEVATSPSADWKLHITPKVGAALVDVLTPEYRGHCDPHPDATTLAHVVERARSTLSAPLRSFFDDQCRAVAPECPDGRWIAGLIRVSPPECDGPALLEAACRDYTERLLVLCGTSELSGPQSAGLGLQSALVEIAAARMANRLLGRPAAGGETEQARTWDRIAARLATTAAGDTLLQLLGEETCAALPAAEAAEPPPDATLRIPVNLPGIASTELTLTKTRSRTAFTIDDFSAINALAKLPRNQVELLFGQAAAKAGDSEAMAFCASIAAYTLGQFEYCAAALVRCLQADDDVEEYWHLLAFTLRNLKQNTRFDQIMFQKRRDASLLNELDSYRPLLEKHDE